MYRMDWTDDRLQERFDSIDHRFDEVDRRFDGVDRQLAEMNQRFEAMNRTLMQVGGGIIATLIAGIMGVIATQL
ncbi:MAG TPA: hypothetical protein VIM28_03320 [Solirubrobacterales bacterium]